MGHSNTMRLHRMPLAVVVVTDVTFVRNTKKMEEHEDKIRPLIQQNMPSNFIKLVLCNLSTISNNIELQFAVYHRNSSKLFSFRPELCTPCRVIILCFLGATLKHRSWSRDLPRPISSRIFLQIIIVYYFSIWL